MSVRSTSHRAAAQQRGERPLPPGTGILITGAASLLMWGIIAGVVAII